MPWDPCLTPLERPSAAGGRRVRIVEVLATGTNGGAQEHLFSLVTRLDPARYDVSVVSLSAGSAVRKLQRAGVAVLVIEDPDDSIAVGAVELEQALEQHPALDATWGVGKEPVGGPLLLVQLDEGLKVRQRISGVVESDLADGLGATDLAPDFVAVLLAE